VHASILKLLGGVIFCGALAWAQTSVAVTATTFSPDSYNSDVDEMNIALGLTEPALVFEDFEDNYLIPGLRVSWDDSVPTNVLGGTFFRISSPEPETWDGASIPGHPRSLSNLKLPNTSVFPTKITFLIDSGASRFGIGFVQFEKSRNEAPTISVNGIELLLNLYDDPNFTDKFNAVTGLRNLYLVLEVGPNDDPITSVSVELGADLAGLSGRDFVIFDHVAILPADVDGDGYSPPLDCNDADGSISGCYGAAR
jgi:hypothetical protein